MGCGSSKSEPLEPVTVAAAKRERSKSIVTIESQQRTVAAYRRQRMARDLEQDLYLRAEAEVEKALMLKRSSVDERRPSYVLRALKDLQEIQEGHEETEQDTSHPTIMVDSCSDIDLKSTNDHLTSNYDCYTNNSDDYPNNDEDTKRNDINKTNNTIEHSYQTEKQDQDKHCTEKSELSDEPEYHTKTPEHDTDRPEYHTDAPEHHTNKPEYHTKTIEDRTDKNKDFACAYEYNADDGHTKAINGYNDDNDHILGTANLHKPEHRTEIPDNSTNENEHYTNEETSQDEHGLKSENIMKDMKGHGREEDLDKQQKPTSDEDVKQLTLEKSHDLELSQATNQVGERKMGGKEMGGRKMKIVNNENCINENLEHGSLQNTQNQDVENTKTNTDSVKLEDNMEVTGDGKS